MVSKAQRDIRRTRQVLEYAVRIRNIRKTCRHVGSPRSLFYVWRAAFERDGEAGLVNKRPVARSPPRPTRPEVVEQVLHVRRTYHRGPQRIVWYLASAPERQGRCRSGATAGRVGALLQLRSAPRGHSPGRPRTKHFENGYSHDGDCPTRSVTSQPTVRGHRPAVSGPAWSLGRARCVPGVGRVGPPRRHVCRDRWLARTVGLDAIPGAQTGGGPAPATPPPDPQGRALTRCRVVRGGGVMRSAGRRDWPCGAADGPAPPAPAVPDRRPAGRRRRAVPARG